MDITSDDVARLAGVSRATVSYVINNGPRPVSAETRERVLDAIRRLGYQPNAVARNLRLQRTSTLGLIVPDTHNPYFSEVARGIEDVAFEQGYTVMLCHSGANLEREMQYVDMLYAQRVAGVIWIPGTADFKPFHKLKEYAIHTVIIDRLVQGETVPAVIADNMQGGYLATQHLIELGHKRIAYVSRPLELSHSQGRYDGYRAALRDYGIDFDESLVVRAGFQLEDGSQAARQLLTIPQPPTAIFAYNDIMAIGVLRALHEAGLKIPQDFSVVGFDDIVQASYTCPSLTTIFLPKFEMGQRGTYLLLSLIDKQSPPEEIMTPLGVELIKRESSGPAPQ